MLGNLNDSRLLFRRHRAQATGVIHRLDDDLVRYDVELLLNFALHVLGFRRAEDVGETGHADLAGDHLRGERDVVQDAGELAGGLRMLALLLDDEPLDGDDRRCGVSDHAVLRSLASSARELGCYMMSQALSACSCPSRLESACSKHSITATNAMRRVLARVDLEAIGKVAAPRALQQIPHRKDRAGLKLLNVSEFVQE